MSELPLTALQKLGMRLEEAKRLLALHRAWRQAEWALLDALEAIAARNGRERTLAITEVLMETAGRT